MLSFFDDPHTRTSRVERGTMLILPNQKNTLKNIIFTRRFHVAQELSEDNFYCQVNFSEIVMELYDNYHNFFSNIVFSDEDTCIVI